MHANETALVTSIDETGSAWRMVPQSVVNAVPEDVFNALASGKFCERITSEPQQFDAATPSDDWLCVICLDEGQKGSILASCGHIFHGDCIASWFRKSSRCPLCRHKCRVGAAIVSLEPMVFDLEPWPMLSDGVISLDVQTSAQDRVSTQRAQAPVSTGRIESRRQRLAERFGCQVPSSGFLQERLITDEDAIGLAAALARHALHREEAALAHAQLALKGCQFTSWPDNGRWPALPMNARNSFALAQLRKRKEVSRLQVQCRTPKGLAQYVLKVNYKKALRDQTLVDQDVVKFCHNDSSQLQKDVAADQHIAPWLVQEPIAWVHPKLDDSKLSPHGRQALGVRANSTL